MGRQGQICIGTVLLERNRWAKPEKTPSFRASDWAGRFAGAGFDGMELWQFHATRAAAGEVERLADGPCPVAVFNIYPTMTDAERGTIEECTAFAGRLGAGAVKFNVGGEPARRGEHLDNLRRWCRDLPAGIAPLCECHPGTILEEPEAAARFFDEPGLERCRIIVHPFSRHESLAEWLRIFGARVAHAHLQMRDPEGKRILRFDRRPELAREAVGLMRSAGYRGSWTLEFAEGTGEPGESIEGLWATALDDLAFLRELLK